MPSSAAHTRSRRRSEAAADPRRLPWLAIRAGPVLLPGASRRPAIPSVARAVMPCQRRGGAGRTGGAARSAARQPARRHQGPAVGASCGGPAPPRSRATMPTSTTRRSAASMPPHRAVAHGEGRRGRPRSNGSIQGSGHACCLWGFIGDGDPVG
jgi:hypothetical protein